MAKEGASRTLLPITKKVVVLAPFEINSTCSSRPSAARRAGKIGWCKGRRNLYHIQNIALWSYRLVSCHCRAPYHCVLNSWHASGKSTNNDILKHGAARFSVSVLSAGIAMVSEAVDCFTTLTAMWNPTRSAVRLIADK